MKIIEVNGKYFTDGIIKLITYKFNTNPLNYIRGTEYQKALKKIDNEFKIPVIISNDSPKLNSYFINISDGIYPNTIKKCTKIIPSIFGDEIFWNSNGTEFKFDTTFIQCKSILGIPSYSFINKFFSGNIKEGDPVLVELEKIQGNNPNVPSFTQISYNIKLKNERVICSKYDYKTFKAPIDFDDNEIVAVQRFLNGEKFSVSTSIDEDTILAGYGELNYDFEFPLPSVVIKQVYGTTSWNTYLTKSKQI